MRVFLADDDTHTHTRLSELIERMEGWVLADEACDMDGFVSRVVISGADVILCSIAFLALLSKDEAAQISGTLPGAAIVAISDKDDHEELRLALKLGAADLIAARHSDVDIVETVRRHEAAAGLRHSYSAKQAAFAEEDTPIERRARIALFTGSKGGTGATFLSLHAASVLAAGCVDVILADMDKHAGVAMRSGGKAPSTSALKPVMDELNEDHVRRLLEPCGRFRLLRLEAEGAGRILDAARGLADVIMVDAHRGEIPTEVMTSGDIGFVIASQTISALKAAEGLRSELSGGCSVVGVLNKHGAALRLKERDLAHSSAVIKAFTVPECAGASRFFELEGKAAIGVSPLFDAAITDICREIIPFTAEEPAPWWRRIAGR